MDLTIWTFQICFSILRAYIILYINNYEPCISFNSYSVCVPMFYNVFHVYFDIN